AAPEALGPPRVAPRPHGRRLRPPPAGEDRPPLVASHVHPDALWRRLPPRAGLEERRRRARLVGDEPEAGLDHPAPVPLVDDVDRLVLAVRPGDPEPHRRPAP